MRQWKPVAIFLVPLLLIGGYLMANRKRFTPEERQVADRATAESVKAGWWQDGYRVRTVTRHREGWYVGVKHPGNYVGGHHSVLLDSKYQLVRLIGGK